MMKRLKSSEVADRLSELPDSLILDILSLLPMRDVVMTTVLSKRWKGLWTSVPSLIFDAEHNRSKTFRKTIYSQYFTYSGRFRDFVNRAMFHWNGTKLQKFSLKINSKSFSSDVDTWLHVAIKKGVEEVCMDMKPYLYSPPQSLYSCSTIRKASLVHCKLEIKGDVQWSQLTSLRIELERRSGAAAIEKVLSGAPQLETLILSYADISEEVLDIKSKSLRRLKIERLKIEGNMIRRKTPRISTVRICTPNVEALEISGIPYTNYLPNVEALEISEIPYTNYLPVNVSSLTRVKVGGFNLPRANGFNLHRSKIRAKVFYRPSAEVIGGNSDFLKGLLEHFFPNIRRLEKVTLSCWFVEVLREIKKENKHIVAPFSDVKFLILYATCVDDVVDILEIFPALTMLVVLQETQTPKYPHFFEVVCPSREACMSEFEAEKSLNPKSIFQCPYLRTVEITWTVCDNSIFSLIEFLSKNVRKLEKMVIRLTSTGSGVPVSASQKLLSAQKSGSSLPAASWLSASLKSFPAADIIFCQD